MPPNLESTLCHCGKPLHYSDPATRLMIEGLIYQLGERVIVQHSSGRRYLVPRHYIALHGLTDSELPTLGFEEAG